MNTVVREEYRDQKTTIRWTSIWLRPTTNDHLNFNSKSSEANPSGYGGSSRLPILTVSPLLLSLSAQVQVEYDKIPPLVVRGKSVATMNIVSPHAVAFKTVLTLSMKTRMKVPRHA